MITMKVYLLVLVCVVQVWTWTVDVKEVRKDVAIAREDRRTDERRGAQRSREERWREDERIRDERREEKRSREEQGRNEVDGRYAQKYQVQHYTEREEEDDREAPVADVGGAWLDGLRGALLHYAESVRNCTQWQALQAQRLEPFGAALASLTRAECERVRRDADTARRLADVALWAARRLQDLPTATGRQKEEEAAIGAAEQALVSKLAWALDRLARITGFRSQNTDRPSAQPKVDEDIYEDEEEEEPFERELLLTSHDHSRHKREIEDPFQLIAKYYIKYKIWDFANPKSDPEGNGLVEYKQDFDIGNDLPVKVIKKRQLPFEEYPREEEEKQEQELDIFERRRAQRRRLLGDLRKVLGSIIRSHGLAKKEQLRKLLKALREL